MKSKPIRVATRYQLLTKQHHIPTRLVHFCLVVALAPQDLDPHAAMGGFEKHRQPLVELVGVDKCGVDDQPMPGAANKFLQYRLVRISAKNEVVMCEGRVNRLRQRELIELRRRWGL